MTNEKKSGTVLLNTILFLSMIFSQLVLYFSKSTSYSKEINIITDKLQLTTNQMYIFQGISVILYSSISFLFMYMIYILFLSLLSKKSNRENVFVSLVSAITISCALGIVAGLFSAEYVPAVVAVSQVITFMCYFIGLSKFRDVRGTMIIGIIGLISCVLPLFLF